MREDVKALIRKLVDVADDLYVAIEDCADTVRSAIEDNSNKAVADFMQFKLRTKEKVDCGTPEQTQAFRQAMDAAADSLVLTILNQRNFFGSTAAEGFQWMKADEVRHVAAQLRDLSNTGPTVATHALNDPEVRQQVRALTDGRCSYCDCDLPDNWHIDHVVPKSAGGPDNIANYVPSCPTCNISKNGNHVLDFIKKSRGKVVAFRSEGAA